MSTHPVSDERLREICEAADSLPTRTAAATRLGINESTLRHHLRTAARRGLRGFAPVMDCFEVSKVTTDPKGRSHVTQKPERGPAFEVPAGHAVKGVSSLIDGEGRTIQQWIKTKGEPEPADIAAEIKAGLLDLRGKAPYIAIPPVANEDLLAAFYFADAHLGQRSWHEEVGVNYDLGIAEEQICGAYDEAIARAPRCDTALIAILGDYTHADDETAQTPASKHILDVDGRFGKTRRVASRILRYKIDRARERFRNIP